MIRWPEAVRLPAITDLGQDLLTGQLALGSHILDQAADIEPDGASDPDSGKDPAASHGVDGGTCEPELAADLGRRPELSISSW